MAYKLTESLIRIYLLHQQLLEMIEETFEKRKKDDPKGGVIGRGR